MVEGRGIPLGRVLAPAHRHDSPLLVPTLDKLGDIGPLPGDITVHLDAGYDSQKTRDELAGRGMTGDIADRGDKAPIQAGQRWKTIQIQGRPARHHCRRPPPGDLRDAFDRIHWPNSGLQLPGFTPVTRRT